MDPNEHSPIARCIEKMQHKWLQAVEQNPDYKLACWQIDPQEAALLNGFCKLESSRHGGLPELFMVMLTPFESEETFSRHLLEHWLALWQADAALSEDEQLPFFKAQALQEQTRQEQARQTADPQAGNWQAMLLEVLTHFYTLYGNPDQPLVLGLLPRHVADFAAYNDWLLTMAAALPIGIKLMVVDHLNKNYLKPATAKLKEKALLIACGDLALREAMQALATGGDQSAPEVQFRQCLFRMGQGAAAKNRSTVEEWGEKALAAAQRSGKPAFWATAHLVYAGFLMHFRAGSKIHALLDQGIGLAQRGIKASDQTCTPILLQLYGYKSAWHSMCAERGVAAEWMGKQAELAIENGLLLQGVTACRMAAALFDKNGNTEPFYQYTVLGYQTGLVLDEQTLKSTDYVLLARDYYAFCERKDQQVEARAVDQRMGQWYGPDWLDDLHRQKARGKSLSLNPVV